MTNRAPAYQFYPDKWDSHTLHLSDAAYTAYHRLLNWIWCHTPGQFRIKSEQTVLQIATRCDPEKFAAVWAEIMSPAMPLLKKRGKYLISGGLRKEAEKQKARREKARDSANARWEQCERNASASPEQCSPSVVTSPSTVVSVKGGKGEHPSLPMIVKQFCSKAKWIGDKAKVWQCLSDAIGHYGDGPVSAEVAKCEPGDKPWEIADRLSGKDGRKKDGPKTPPIGANPETPSYKKHGVTVRTDGPLATPEEEKHLAF